MHVVIIKYLACNHRDGDWAYSGELMSMGPNGCANAIIANYVGQILNPIMISFFLDDDTI